MKIGQIPARQYLLLVLLYLIAPAEALLPVEDPDIWWHLRTGQWIVEHGWVPTTDPFSAHGAGQPWLAYSWLFELIVYGLHSHLGLVGLVLYTVVGAVAITAAIHLLVRRAGLPFGAEILLTAVAAFCLKPQLTPRPWLFSILFFTLVLHILVAARTSGNLRSLYFLPVIFLFWANLHIQFVYGLALLVFLTIEPVARRLFPFNLAEGSKDLIPLDRLVIITLLCTAATFVTPYHIQLYRPVFEYALQTRVFQNIAEFHPMFFREPQNWLVLGFALGTAFILGWRRETRLFPYLLLIMGAFLAFRARRDTWVLVVASLAIIVEQQMNREFASRVNFNRRQVVALTVGVIVSLFGIGYYRNVSEENLVDHVTKRFPVEAVRFVKNNQEQGSLYNHLNWGGYLIWALPEIPVSMDGRTNLHGEQRIERSLATWSGHPGWSSDPELTRANVIIAEVHRPLTSLLRTDHRFRLVYSDHVAAVFVRNER